MQQSPKMQVARLRPFWREGANEENATELLFRQAAGEAPGAPAPHSGGCDEGTTKPIAELLGAVGPRGVQDGSCECSPTDQEIAVRFEARRRT